MQKSGFLTTAHRIHVHQIEKSYVLPWVRNSYITPKAHVLFLNISSIGHHVTSLLVASQQGQMMSFFLKMVDVNAEYFKVKLNSFKFWPAPKSMQEKESNRINKSVLQVSVWLYSVEPRDSKQ